MSERRNTPVSNASGVQHQLLVYAMRTCPGWSNATDLVTLVREHGIGGLEVRLVDLSAHDAPVPDFVVASPTWSLDGRRLSLGNPDPEWLLARVAALEDGD